MQVLGVQVDAIERGEDRLEFKKAMNELGIEMAKSEIANTVDEALAIAERLGYPVVVRPAYTRRVKNSCFSWFTSKFSSSMFD